MGDEATQIHLNCHYRSVTYDSTLFTAWLFRVDIASFEIDLSCFSLLKEEEIKGNI